MTGLGGGGTRVCRVWSRGRSRGQSRGWGQSWGQSRGRTLLQGARGAIVSLEGCRDGSRVLIIGTPCPLKIWTRSFHQIICKPNKIDILSTISFQTGFLSGGWISLMSTLGLEIRILLTVKKDEPTNWAWNLYKHIYSRWSDSYTQNRYTHRQLTTNNLQLSWNHYII